MDEKLDSSVACPRTFEDALALQNIDFFRNADGLGLVKKIKDAVAINKDISELHEAILKALDNASKAEFALDILFYPADPALIEVPEYIHNGLAWLEDKLLQRQKEVVVTESKEVEAPGKGAK